MKEILQIPNYAACDCSGPHTIRELGVNGLFTRVVVVEVAIIYHAIRYSAKVVDKAQSIPRVSLARS